jgi:iron uptake system component EfeO
LFEENIMRNEARPFARVALITGALVGLAACGSTGETQEQSVARAMQQSLQARLTTLWTSAQALQTAAPVPTGRGWDATMDAQALTAMKTAWVAARSAYEHVEGATAPVYPDLDVSLDERYDGFLAALGPQGDADLFDDQGVTGMHAIERILYVDVTPAPVVAFEKTLPGYMPAAWPATEAQAAEFKTKLCARLVTDAKTLLDGWTPAHIDVSGAFQGLIGLVNEQQEKVNKAATGEEESRYSQHTMADLRDNLDGTTTIYDLFGSWLVSKPAVGAIPSGADVDASITTGFAGLAAVYGTVQGDAIPQPPATWSAETPSAADLATPFGQLYTKVHDAVDPTKPDSIVSHMNDGAQLLGIPGFAP